MACVQQCRAQEGVHEKHNGVVDKILKEAECLLKKHHHHHHPCHDQPQVLVGGSMVNHAKERDHTLVFHNKYEWRGHFLEKYPEALKECHPGTFVHAGNRFDPCKPLPPGSKAALVYFSSNVKNACGCDGRAWLLAWSVDPIRDRSAYGLRNKVYVEAGAADKYKNIDWCKIEKKLDESSSKCNYVDQCTGAMASAAISDGDIAALAAVFDRILLQ